MLVLTELNNRGVKNAFVFCADALTGLPNAIKGLFPKSDIHLCIVLLVRNSLKYVSWTYRKELAREWNEKSSAIYALWERYWVNVVPIFTYPSEIRQVIYATNAIALLNSVIWSRIKTKRILGSNESAQKLV